MRGVSINFTKYTGVTVDSRKHLGSKQINWRYIATLMIHRAQWFYYRKQSFPQNLHIIWWEITKLRILTTTIVRTQIWYKNITHRAVGCLGEYQRESNKRAGCNTSTEHVKVDIRDLTPREGRGGRRAAWVVERLTHGTRGWTWGWPCKDTLRLAVKAMWAPAYRKGRAEVQALKGRVTLPEGPGWAPLMCPPKAKWRGGAEIPHTVWGGTVRMWTLWQVVWMGQVPFVGHSYKTSKSNVTSSHTWHISHLFLHNRAWAHY